MRLVWMLLLLTCRQAQSEDWPQFLGPGRNGVYPGPSPQSVSAAVWKIDVGQGFSGPVAARDRVILFHRRENRAIVESLDAATGKRVWLSEYPTDYRDDFGFDEGPRATPAIAGAEFTLSARRECCSRSILRRESASGAWTRSRNSGRTRASSEPSALLWSRTAAFS